MYYVCICIKDFALNARSEILATRPLICVRCRHSSRQGEGCGRQGEDHPKSPLPRVLGARGIAWPGRLSPLGKGLHRRHV